MLPIPEGYVRKGKALNLQIDHDAVEMLREIAPTQKSHGWYLSELIRRDYLWRQQWQQVRAALPAMVEVVSD